MPGISNNIRVISLNLFEALIVAPIFAIGVGIFFGFYPARRTTQLDPIAALRHE